MKFSHTIANKFFLIKRRNNHKIISIISLLVFAWQNSYAYIQNTIRLQKEKRKMIISFSQWEIYIIIKMRDIYITKKSIIIFFCSQQYRRTWTWVRAIAIRRTAASATLTAALDRHCMDVPRHSRRLTARRPAVKTRLIAASWRMHSIPAMTTRATPRTQTSPMVLLSSTNAATLRPLRRAETTITIVVVAATTAAATMNRATRGAHCGGLTRVTTRTRVARTRVTTSTPTPSPHIWKKRSTSCPFHTPWNCT